MANQYGLIIPFNVPASTTVQVIVAARTNAAMATIKNTSQNASLYIHYGYPPSPTSYTYEIGPGFTWEAPPGDYYAGDIYGVWDGPSPTGAAIGSYGS